MVAPRAKPRAGVGVTTRRMLMGALVVVSGVVVINALTLQDQRHAAPLAGKTATIAVKEEPVEAKDSPVRDAAREQAASHALQNAPQPAPRQIALARATDAQTTTQTVHPSDPIARELARGDAGKLRMDAKAKPEPQKDGKQPVKADALKTDIPKTDTPKHDAPKVKAAVKPVDAKHAVVKPAPRPARTAEPAKKDAIAALIEPAKNAAPEKSVLSAQRALQKLGYVVAPNGVYGAGTKQALAQFERDHQMPVTGALSQKTVRELTRLTGDAAR